ncbi:D-aminoacyl-tRNA deacylase isoform X2 [Rosa chinensis]|uniref:D-aminoacyl-tRNA deacylase isoform X2 n=1 Tax=Rosa chinensis TaxID=74649 RepID=UPI000D08B098|nr:D-aminoacyl-tRNA deacylase isoform X2 [Rosa chinensis]
MLARTTPSPLLTFATTKLACCFHSLAPKKSPNKMVKLIVATTTDPASVNPANALLSKPGWSPTPSLLQEDMKSFANGAVRVLVHNRSIIEEDDLDARWEQATGEHVDELIFLSKHKAASSRPALTVHPIGVPHLRNGDVLPQGGKPGWAAPPNPRIGPWLRLLKRIAQDRNLVPEFEVTLEATHHGPITDTPAMFLEIGSTDDCWKRQDAAEVMALLVWEGLGLGGGAAVGNWNGKDDVWVGHLISGYSLPMEDPSQSKTETNTKDIGGTWKQSIKVAFEATQSAFPGGEIVAHLDHKSFKSWQKNAITSFLEEQNITISKRDFF